MAVTRRSKSWEFSVGLHKSTIRSKSGVFEIFYLRVRLNAFVRLA